MVIGFAAEEQAALENASVESKANEWMDLAEAVDVSADEFDWQEAMRTELAWLRDEGGIAGLPYRETSQPLLLRSSADCGGFSLDALPERTLENVPTTHEIMSEHTTFSPFGYVAIIGAMAVGGAGALIRYRRGRR